MATIFLVFLIDVFLMSGRDFILSNFSHVGGVAISRVMAPKEKGTIFYDISVKLIQKFNVRDLEFRLIEHIREYERVYSNLQ